jgi:hypothetical protein
MLSVKCYSKGDAVNFYHFITQQLLGIWNYSNNNQNQVLNFYYDGPYIEIIKMIPFLRWFPLHQAPEECIAIKPIKSLDPKLANEYSNYLKSIFFSKINIKKDKNILIVQRGHNRIIKNEDELLLELKKLGEVSVVTLECLPFIQQVQNIRNARIIIVAHGAGLAHMMFADPCASFIEIYSKGFHSYYPYRDLAQKYNLKYSNIEAIYSSTEYYSDEDIAYMESFKDKYGKIDGKILVSPEHQKLRVLVRDPKYIKCDVNSIIELIKKLT